jgi:glycine/sarcosine N-methyltransferase
MDKNADTYKDFAARYDLFFEGPPEHESERREFFSRLFSLNKVNRVLDCACGTGHDLIMFNSLGCTVTGSDLSDSMLEEARENLSASNLSAPLIKADYRELPARFQSSFDAAVCLSTSICEMPDESETLKAFTSMHRVLRPGGILILTQGTSDKQWNEKPRFIPMVNTQDFSRVCVIDYFEKSARYNILDIYHSGEKTDFKVWSIMYTGILLRDDFERLLKQAGFEDVDFYGDFDFKPYSKETSSRLIAIAKKG